MCEWLDFDYFSGIPTLGSSHVNFVFFLKKKKKKKKIFVVGLQLK